MTDQPPPPQPPPPQPPPPAPPKTVERAHPLTPLIRGWVLVGALAYSWGRDLLEGQQSFLSGPLLIGALALGTLGAASSWWFSRFVIDEDEVREDTGFVFRRSRRVAYRRIQAVDLAQPLLARLTRLAEVRIEVAGGGPSSRVVLRYLPLARAQALRTELLARADWPAPGMAAPPPAATAPPQGPQDLLPPPAAPTWPPLTLSVPPGRLVGACVISVEFAAAATVAAAALLLWQVWHQPWAAPFAIPAVLSTVGIVSRRVVAQYGFTLVGDSHTVRIRRGLAAVSAQSIPVTRIQAVRLQQPLTWRPLGWWRAEVTVAGYGHADEHAGAAATTLVPVADEAQLRAILGLAMPEVELAHAWAPVSRRAFWMHPVGWRFMGWYAGPLAFSVRRGWLMQTIGAVPYSRAQAVAVHQGPVQRLMGLATLHVHLPPGPVTVAAEALPEGQARAAWADASRRLTVPRQQESQRAQKVATPPPGSATTW